MKSKNVFIFIVLVTIALVVIIPRPLGNLDEIWNFNFAKNVAEGLLPYKDFNIIVGPLFPILTGLILRVFGVELIVMRILAGFFFGAMFFLTYKILKLLEINNYIVLLSMVWVVFLSQRYLNLDYNFAVLFVILIVIYVELKNKDKILNFNLKLDLLLGIFIGLTISLKWTIGVCICFIYVFYKLLLFEFKKETIKILIVRSIGVFIALIGLYIYLITNNIVSEFFNYSIYGIKTFSNYRSYMGLIKGNILSIIIPVMFIYLFFTLIFKKHNNKKNINLFIMFCYGIGCFIIVFPISDEMHFIIGAFPRNIMSNLYD